MLSVGVVPPGGRAEIGVEDVGSGAGEKSLHVHDGLPALAGPDEVGELRHQLPHLSPAVPVQSAQ